MNQTRIKQILKTNPSQIPYSLLFKTKKEQVNWFKKLYTNTSYQPLIKEVEAEAERLLHEAGEELSFSLFKLFNETGSRLEYEKVYFAKRRRLNTFAIMFLLEPEEPIYREELENIIWSICNEYTWCLPAHLNNSSETSINKYSFFQKKPEKYSIDLFAAETAFTLSEIYRLTKDFMDPLVGKCILQEIDQRIISPYLNQDPFAWETARHNWAAVCAGSIGSVALHLFAEDDKLSIVLERVLHTMDCYLEGFNDDGTCLEGYGYWEYGFGFYVYFADLLKKRTIGEIDLFKIEKVHQIALFQQRTFLEKNTVVNFSDAQPTTTVFLGLSHYLANTYPDVEIPEEELRSHYTADHTSRWAPAFRNLLWFDSKANGKPWSENTYYLKDSQWLIARHFSETGKYAFAVKGGHNDEPHNHNDIGHFMLQGNGAIFLKDLGSGLYNDAYFGSERYSFLCNGSHGHSVPIINDQFQAEGRSLAASIQNVMIGDEEVTFGMDITNAYSIPSLSQLTREFTWEKATKPTLTLLDTYAFLKDPKSIVERLITPIHTIIKDSKGITLGRESKLRIKFDQDKLKLKINKIEFINHFGETEENIALDFIVKRPEKECSVQLIFQFE